MAEVDSKIFRAYDIRGLYPSEVNKKAAFLIGRALGDFLGARKVVVGRGVRFSSKKLSKKLIKGLLEQGVNVIDIGLVSTPVLFWRVFKEGIDAGIIVTASHNPIEYNGFKILKANGEMIGVDTGFKEIQEIIKKNNFKNIARKGEYSQEQGAIEKYVQEIIKSFPDFERLKKFRIAVDAAGGPGGLVMNSFFKHLESELFALEFKLDPYLRHEPNPLILETIQDLKKTIQIKKCDFGFALDGDADRVIILDERGEFVPPDLVIALLAKEILKENPGAKIAYDHRSSKAVPERIKEMGGIPVKMPVGSAIIKRRMKKEKIIFGGETSGHYLFQETFYAESPLFVILHVLKILTEENEPLSEVMKRIQKYFKSNELNFELRDKEKVFAAVKERYNDAQISFFDGITIEYPDWWFNLRPSRTEPLLRLNLEAKEKGLFEEKLEEVKNLITSA